MVSYYRLNHFPESSRQGCPVKRAANDFPSAVPTAHNSPFGIPTAPTNPWVLNDCGLGTVTQLPSFQTVAIVLLAEPRLGPVIPNAQTSPALMTADVKYLLSPWSFGPSIRLQSLPSQCIVTGLRLR